MVLEEEELSEETLVTAVRSLYENRESFIDAMRDSNQHDSINTIIALIEEAVSSK